MKVILNDYVPSLGGPGEEVDVAPGYARNYLIPKKLGFEATEANRKTYENNLKQRARKIAKILNEAEAQKASLEGQPELVFTRKAGEEGKLFGSVTSADIQEALKERGFDIDKKRIDLTQPIKSIGETDVTIRLHTKVTGTVKVVVQAEIVKEEKAEETGEEGAPAAEDTEEAQEAAADESAGETAEESLEPEEKAGE